jgi:hypothetical protein
MMSDNFGFGQAAEEAEFKVPAIAPKKVDRGGAEVAREAGAQEGVHRRVVAPASSAPKSAARASSMAAAVSGKAKGRVKLSELDPIPKERFAGEARGQLNILAPAPVILAWRQLVQETGIPQWELIEEAEKLIRARRGL